MIPCLLPKSERGWLPPSTASMWLGCTARGHSYVPGPMVPTLSLTTWTIVLRRSCPDTFPFASLKAQLSPACCLLPAAFPPIRYNFSISPSLPSPSACVLPSDRAFTHVDYNDPTPAVVHRCQAEIPAVIFYVSLAEAP